MASAICGPFKRFGNSMRKYDPVRDELLQEFYGLDASTMAVDCVAITIGGDMYRWSEMDGYVCARLSGPSMQAEVTQHFGLVYLVAVQPDASTALRLQVMRSLRATAGLFEAEA